MGEATEDREEKPASGASRSRFQVLAGAKNVVVGKKLLFQICIISIGILAGMLLAERMRLQRNSQILKESKGAMKGTNARLKAEKDDYKNLFKQMSSQLEEWKAAHDLSAESQQKQITSFKESSEALMLGLDDVRTVLEEKEFQLWEKEGLLEYQEERLLDSEDQEVQMAHYINLLAQQLIASNMTLPEGLEEQPYYGQERARNAATDDDAMVKDDKLARRRLLRADDPKAATVAALQWRTHLLEEKRAELAAARKEHQQHSRALV